MEKNERFYKAAWYLINAAREIKELDKELANLCLDKADDLRKRIVIDEDEIAEIEKYKGILKE